MPISRVIVSCSEIYMSPAAFCGLIMPPGPTPGCYLINYFIGLADLVSILLYFQCPIFSSVHLGAATFLHFSPHRFEWRARLDKNPYDGLDPRTAGMCRQYGN